MRRMLVTGAVAALGLFAVLPPVGADEQPGFFGFEHLTTVAQGQVATGYFFAIGDEVNRLVGARTEVDGPPINGRAVAAFVQRGIGATYVYGVAGGPGGTSGALPDPPPGEAPAYYPTDPHETTFSGPVSAVLDGGEARTVDGRFHARATEEAAGAAEASVTRFTVPGYFTVDGASVTSRGAPVADGGEAESVSVLRGLVVGPVRIESLTSKAYGFVPSLPGDPRGAASTVVEGATVGKTPVKVTDQGIVVADKGDPTAAQQVRAALAQAGLRDVRLLPSVANPSDNNQQVTAQAGGIQIIHNDEKFGASNPQGFRGGGFALGGAEVNVTGRRCDPACASPIGAGDTPGLSFDPPAPASSETASTPTEPQPAESGASAASAIATPPVALDFPAGASMEGLAGAALPTASGSTVTMASGVTPESPPGAGRGDEAAAPATSTVRTPQQRPPGRPPRLNALLTAAGGMAPGDGRDVARIFLAGAGSLALVVISRGLSRAR